MNATNIKPLIGLLGVLVAALSADLNEFVSAAALTDVRGAVGISADPGRWIDSLYVTGNASGTTFATLQPDNATGNFTKIARRLPVKIVPTPSQPTARLLRVGLSVEATIETELADVVAASR